MSNGQKQIDWSKPVQTRDGRKVRVLCTDGPNEKRPVVGYVDGYGEPTTWEPCGTFSEHGNSLDLVNAPERVERWFNLYESEAGCAFPTKAESVVAGDRQMLALVKVTFEDGKPVSVALEAR